MYEQMHYWGINNFANSMSWSSFHPVLELVFWVVVVPVFIIALVLKGWALWVAARKGQRKWFVALLLVNTFGILELLYIFHFSKKK